MDTLKHALVLTGDVQPGHDAANVWPALATFFRMDPERLRAELLSRVPIAIKESDDLAKLQTLQAGAASVGAVTELHALGAEGSLFVLVDNTPRGPVPHAFVEERVRSGAWPTTINVAAVGSNTWRPFLAPAPAPRVAPAPQPVADQQATVAFSAVAADAAPTAVHPAAAVATAAAAGGGYAAAAPGGYAGAPAAAGDMLPEGAIVHAGFWRRCAAYVFDSIVLTIIFAVLMAVVGGIGVASGNLGVILGLTMLVYVLLIVLAWLYFAKLESGTGQATFGKRIMGLKVTDDRGNRISFGRATGRFFGKIVSGMIFNIGYMMAGWTGRKQGLHDMMANTCVVFRTVEPGRPLPAVRPPMPWYGWLLNVLPFLAAIGYSVFVGQMVGTMAALQGAGMGSSNPFEESSLPAEVTSVPGFGGDNAEADKAAVQAGLSGITAEIEGIKAEAAQAAQAGECLSDERTSSNPWIDSIQLGGYTPECSVTVRLSSSSDIPFAARIERIEWTLSNGEWSCSSSMDSSYLPWPCQ
ncbi:RDD family protein [Dokdonella sp. MW10]|uniref:RDD family protein n=1 Tax=Dokdonella sp. MW10 TaxID=2992926 RepID=UPI003F80CA7F